MNDALAHTRALDGLVKGALAGALAGAAVVLGAALIVGTGGMHTRRLEFSIRL